MKKILLCIACLISVVCLKAQNALWPPSTAETKPWTRWWWLGSAVDKTNLTYNLEALSRAGIGGVEITPIYGVKNADVLSLDYLSPRWMEMLAYTESESHRLGMKTDMNTGTGWPFGGPEVTVEEAATKAIFQEYTITGGRKIDLKIAVEDKKQESVACLSKLMAYCAKGEKRDITPLVKNGWLNWRAPAGEWKLIALFVGKTLQQVKRAAPGGEGYVVNHFDKKAVANYFKKFDRAFSRNDTCYPNAFFNDSYEVYGANWSPDLLTQFRKRRGYKLEEYFPELLAKGKTDRSRRVVCDYRETMGEMLLENFTLLWTDWANRNGAITRNQAHGSPANILDLYAAVDIPECEIFGISNFHIPGLRKDSLIKINDGDPVTLKFASSAAHIAGKKYTSSETFTWLTEHFRTSLSQCKPEIDQVFTSGVNHVFFHGTPYSPREAAWPGWLFYAAVNMSPTNSIWKDAPAFFSYINRTQSFLQYGSSDNDMLVYFPVHDIWYEQQDDFYFAFSIHGLRDKLPGFYRTVEKIREGGRDVDYVSDGFILSASVEDGLIKTSGGTVYKALVLPAARFIPLETLEKVYELAVKGAKVIFVDQYPDNVPGWNNLSRRKKELIRYLNKFPKVDFRQTMKNKTGKGEIITGTDYEALFEMAGIERETFSKEFNGQFVRRKNESGYHYFFTLLADKEIDNWVPLAVDARSALFFDPMDGSSGKAKLRTVNGKTEVYMQLKPGESIILKTFTDDDMDIPEWNYYVVSGKEYKLTNGWKLTFVESEPPIRGIFTVDSLISWTELLDESAKKNTGTARYSLTFTMHGLTGDEYLLDLGDVRESARVYLNGKEVSRLFAVPFTTYIGKYLKEGENLLEVDVTNLPANRISDYDKRAIQWRVFSEINFVDINYGDTRYDKWQALPSGLLGPVAIREVHSKSTFN